MTEASRILSEYFTERVWVGILLGGIVLTIIAYYWLTARAIAASRWWRVGYLPPFSFLYLLSGSRRVIAPLFLMIVGFSIAATPFIVTRLIQPLLPRHAWEKNVNGELHVTLTGLTDFDYATLKDRPQISVLQMANPDVTDQSLDALAGLPLLYELDLNGAGITDAGLAKLKSLPKLEVLRIKNTKVTDEGFTENLLPSDRLMKLDARGTEIKGSTLRKWKAAKDGREVMN